MARKRICATALEAVADVRDGASILVHSFGPPQAWPTDLLLALRERRVRDLTIVCNSPAAGPTSLQILADERQIRCLICTYAILPVGPTPISEQIRAGGIEVELVPQGTLTERVRAGAAGLGGVYTPVGVGTVVAEGKEVREFDGRPHLFERAIRTDFAFVCAYPATALGCVQDIVTDLAYIRVTPGGFLLEEVAPGLTVADVQAACAAPLRVAPDAREMRFG